MPGRQRRIQAVLFDLDDTLISWERPAVSREEFYLPRIEKLHCVLSSAGHHPPPYQEFWEIIDRAIMAMWAEAKKTWRITSLDQLLDKVFVDLGLDTSDLDGSQVLQLFDWAPRPGVDPFPETLPVLRALREKGYKTGLLTNSFVPMSLRDVELEAYGLVDLIDQRVSAADVGYLKPHPAIYEELLARLDVAPEEAIFVGDRPANDIAGANAVGLVSVLMKPAYLTRDLTGARPDYTIERLDQLLPVLDSLAISA
ncbi:MAG: HAD family hydrolase [Chloroflexota bacterium]|jgi:HAD superfamily hydrolase (TIGR01509 family)